jgi:signal transduction histidine kinase/DNA-binding response OmpR family regulator
MVGKSNSRCLYTPQDLADGVVVSLRDLVLQTGKAEGTFERVRKDGSQFTASVAVTLRRNSRGEPVGFLIISKDITEHTLLEAELVQKNAQLEEQNRRVEQANRLKSEFLANMSHELRTPLNSILGFSELMAGGEAGPVTDLQKEFLADILTSARHLLQLINDLLDLSKIEAGKMEFRSEPVELGKLVEEVRTVLRTLASRKHLEITSEISPELHDIVLDPAKFKQVLYNYLSNAIKFTPEHGRIAVRIVPEAGDLMRLEVEDTGVGIADADIPRLFVEFQQLDASAAKKFQGTGLGLSLTRRIVEAQGGTVAVRSEVGKGSLFTAVLPRQFITERAPDAVAAIKPGRAKAQRRSERQGVGSVLVIEDNPDDRAWLLKTLRSSGYQVFAAQTGEEAIAACRSHQFHAITLDMLLPDMPGWDALREIRKLSGYAKVPVIVVSVSGEEGTGVGVLVQDFLVKPVKPEDLLDAVRRAGVAKESNPRIMVVDDDPIHRRLADSALRSAGYVVDLFPDGASALAELAQGVQPGGIVLDLIMDGMDGFEFLKRLRATHSDVPVVVWTGAELTQLDRNRLRESTRGVALKAGGRAAALLKEIRRHVPAPIGRKRK